MIGNGIDRAEAERRWRTADRAEERLDMVERALAAIGCDPWRGAGAGSEEFNPGRK